MVYLIGMAVQNISWLHVGKTLIDWRTAVSSNDVNARLGFIRGTIAKGEKETIKLKLANPQQMNYGRPYYREGVITIHNSGSHFRAASALRLLIPKLRLEAKMLHLHADKTSGIISVENAGYGRMRWSLMPLPAKQRWLKFTPHYSSGGEHDHISFSVDPSKIPAAGLHHTQYFAVFSNGDASHAARCKSSAASSFRGVEHVSWPTADCYDFRR